MNPDPVVGEGQVSTAGFVKGSAARAVFFASDGVYLR